MPGTRSGGLKAAEVNKKRHGEDFYREIGRKGGKNGTTGGFAANPELARTAGAKGGHSSSRGIKRKITVNGETYNFSTVVEATKFAKKEFGVRSSKYVNGEKLLFLEDGGTIVVEKDI